MENKSSSSNAPILFTDNAHALNHISPTHLSHAAQEPILS